MINKFSAFFSSAAFVKLKDPVITVSLSMIMMKITKVNTSAVIYKISQNMSKKSGTFLREW